MQDALLGKTLDRDRSAQAGSEDKTESGQGLLQEVGVSELRDKLIG